MIEIPLAVRNKAIAVGAKRWLADLPALVADLAREWGLAVGRSYADATEGFVAEATLDGGTPAVLKLHIPRRGDLIRREATVLRLAGGEGCVRLLRADVARGALLLERLGRSMFQLGLAYRRRLPLLVAAAARMWRPAPGSDLPTGADHARWLASFIPTTWEELDRPCSPRAVDQALACAARRAAAHDDERAVLVHGDVHQWNALESAGGFKLVDPDGLLAEPECDLGVLMREDPRELCRGDPWERARWLAALSGRDATAIWEWGAAERVANGLLLTRIGLQPIGAEMLAAADHAAGHPSPS